MYVGCMSKIQIKITDPQYKLLKDESEKTGNGIAAVIRSAVNKYFEEK